MKFLDLFAGIGGFSLGLERAGMTCVGHVEIEPYCQKILEKHWPDVPLISDIRDVKEDSFERPVDLICGGFPCQPFSAAGKRTGEDDNRYLWPEMLKVIQMYRPTWVLGENVAGIINMALDRVLADLEAIGYTAWTVAVPACAVNAPHIRQRVWILGHCEGKRLEKRRMVGRGERFPIGSSADESDTSRGLGYSDGEGLQGYGESGECSREQTAGQGSWDDCEWIRGWDGKLRRTKPGLGLLAHGVPERVARLKALGNAVVPQVVQKIGEAILEADRCGT